MPHGNVLARAAMAKMPPPIHLPRPAARPRRNRHPRHRALCHRAAEL